MTSVLDAAAYRQIFEPFRGAKAVLTKGLGNVGDRLIEQAAIQLFAAYDIELRSTEDEVDVAFYLGGGNMGTLYRKTTELRYGFASRYRGLGVPFVVLPQSWTGKDETWFDVAYAREVYSLSIEPRAKLAPDLALALEPAVEVPKLLAERGVFFRTDVERLGPLPIESQGDPAKLAPEPEQYLKLAGSYEVVHTNRLHFAIAAMAMGRRAVLYPNSYFKNRGVFELWLKGRGCEWRDEWNGRD